MNGCVSPAQGEEEGGGQLLLRRSWANWELYEKGKLSNFADANASLDSREDSVDCRQRCREGALLSPLRTTFGGDAPQVAVLVQFCTVLNRIS